MITELLIAACLLSGSLIILLAALGILRLPDSLCRGHALGKGMTFGLVLVLLGLWIFLGLDAGGVKVPLAFELQDAIQPGVGICGLLLAAIPLRRHFACQVCRRRGALERSRRLHVTDRLLADPGFGFLEARFAYRRHRAGVAVVRTSWQVGCLNGPRFLQLLHLLCAGGLWARLFETLHFGGRCRGRCCLLNLAVEFKLLLLRQQRDLDDDGQAHADRRDPGRRA